MIAGVSWGWWIGFHAAVAAVLAADSAMPWQRRTGQRAPLPAWMGAAVMELAALGFAGWIALAQGRQAALEFSAGYAMELSLSIDNLFVFLVLFEGFGIGAQRQRAALLWGVWGAFVLRAVFIAAGVALLARFAWVTWVLGMLLLYAAWRLIRGGSARAAVPGWIVRLQPARGSLLPLIAAVEVTDLLFATDSIPAVLSVTHNPFVAYTSNVCAIVGLRSMYFALAAMLERFRLLHYGLGAILAFAALKMLAAPWVQMPATVSLAVIGGVLGVCAWMTAAHRGDGRRAG